MKVHPKLEVTLVDPSDRKSVSEYVDFSAALHGNDPRWSPPGLRRDMVRQVAGRSPYYRHSDAACFLARRGGRPVGRVAALENRPFNQHHRRSAGFFGHFDAVDDQNVADALLNMAREWAIGRGLSEVIGPRGMSGTDGTILVEGFEHPASLGVPWNPQYIASLIERAGFQPFLDFSSGWLPAKTFRNDRLYAVAERARTRGGFQIEGFTTRRQLRRRIPDVIPVFLEAMSETATFYPPSPEEIDETVAALLSIANPRGIKLVRKDDRVVGFLLTYPDLAQALRKAKGRLTPSGIWHLLRARSTTRRFVVNGVGVLPEFRGSGVNAMLYTGTAPDLIDDVGIERAEIAQVAAVNRRSLNDMRSLEVNWYKTHRLYRWTEAT